MMWLTQAARDMLIFGSGMFAGTFVAWQIWLYHHDTIRAMEREKSRQYNRRPGFAGRRAAEGKAARQVKEGKVADRWRWN